MSIKIQRYCFLFMVLMVNLFNYSDNTILKLITNLSVLLFIIVIFMASQGKILMSTAIKPFLIFLLFCFISIGFSTARADSINKIETLILLCFELIAVYHYSSIKGEINHALSIISICTTITAVYIVAQGLPALQRISRVGHITGDSNQVSAYLVYGIVFLIYMLHHKRLPRMISIVGILASFLAIILQGSRTAIVAAGIAVILEVVLLMRYEKVSIPQRAWIIIVILALLTSGIYYIMSNPALYMTLGRRLMSFYQIQTTGYSAINEQSFSNRMTAYRLAFGRFLDNPFFGRGIGSFAQFSAQSALARYGFCPCNYLELLQGIGIIGTLFYYAMYLSAFRSSRRSFKMQNNEYSILVISVLIAMLMEHITVVFYYQKLEYIFLGVLFASCCTKQDRGIVR